MNCPNCLFNFKDAKYRFVLISVTNNCNNSCDYCYLGCNNKINKKNISMDTIKKILEAYCLYLQDFPKEERFLTIIWHGGEPLIAGTGFYEEILKIQKEYAERFNMSFNNGIETNGTLLTEEWADFLSQNHFQIGISLDGPKFIHDIHRRGKDNLSSFSKTLRGIEILEHKRIPFSVISVITNKNHQYYKEMLDYFISFKYLRYADFLPGYDPNGQIEYLNPENYGNFLASLFDYWISLGGSKKIQIRYFDDLILKISNQVKKNTPIGCEIMGKCGEIQYVNEDGQLYPCVTLPQSPELFMGNFHKNSFNEMLKSKNYLDFQNKFNDLHSDCQSCNIYSICKGGCATRRFYHPNKKSDSKDYFCLARKRIINKIKKYLRRQTKMEDEINTFVRGPKPEKEEGKNTFVRSPKEDNEE